MPDGFSTTQATPPLPSLALLGDRAPAPEMPLALFGPVWAGRIAAAAEAKNSRPDYVACGLLAGASVLIGNSRWASPWQDWREPPFLWFGLVGNPSSGKSPGADATFADVLPELEAALAANYPDKLRDWETKAAEAAAIRELWEREVKKAVKEGTPPPQMPKGLVVPPRPIRPRLMTNDPTIQKVAELLRDNERGLLLFRDELAASRGLRSIQWRQGRGGQGIMAGGLRRTVQVSGSGEDC